MYGNNKVYRLGSWWHVSIVYKCNCIVDTAKPIKKTADDRNGITIGHMRQIVRSERGMKCPKCRLQDLDVQYLNH